MKLLTSIALSLSLGLAPALAADAPAAGQSGANPAPQPQRVEVELEPAGVAPGVTVREANIRQNWLLLGLGTAALAGIIFGLSSSSDATSTTN